jgi:hypothetical protein
LSRFIKLVLQDIIFHTTYGWQNNFITRMNSIQNILK